MDEAARGRGSKVRALLHAAAAHPVGRVLSSPRLAVACLGWLFILVLLGTLYQVNHSSYDAQRVFFHSLLAWVGPIPLPAAQLVLAVLGLNLLCSLALRIRWILTNTGLVILHLGLILLLLAGLLSRVGARSTAVSLVEGTDYAVSLDTQHWDLYVESDQGLVSVPVEDLRAGTVLKSPIDGLYLQVDKVVGAAAGGAAASDPALDAPTITLRITDGWTTLQGASLFGGDQVRTRVSTKDRSFTMWVAHTAYLLPAHMRLVDFKAAFYPGSNVPRSFESSVLLTDGPTEREAVISMNHPLRYKGYTFYQSAYGTDPGGQTYSVLQVVRNPGRVLPYLASFVILAGLAAHVLLRRGSPR